MTTKQAEALYRDIMILEHKHEADTQEVCSKVEELLEKALTEAYTQGKAEGYNEGVEDSVKKAEEYYGFGCNVIDEIRKLKQGE